jgi:serine protease Do
MTQSDPSITKNSAGDRRLLTARRLTLLTSVAGLAVAVLLAGPGGFSRAMPGTNAMAIDAAASSSRMSLAASPTDAAQVPQSFADLATKVKPAVISVRVKIDKIVDSDQNGAPNPSEPGSPFYRFFRDFPNGPKGREIITGVGSGFFISADGYAVTNDHVVDHSKSVKVTTDDGSVYTAKVVGADPKTDLALIKVDANKTFSFVKFASRLPRVGDWVVAVGNPFGLGGTVTAGIVSARGRAIDANPYDDYMQIDAPINKGNSGGPTFDVNGNVVGVNTAIYSPSGGSVGIGFDIPATVAEPVIAQLKNTGTVTRGEMGVMVQPVTADIADSLGMKTAEGALVDKTQEGTPAAKAGIEAGDVIRSVNGTTVKSSADLARKIAAFAPGSNVTVEVLRKGEQKTLTLTLGKMSNQSQTRTASESESSSAPLAQLGLAVASARASGMGENGVVVTAVDPDRPAGEDGIKPGDVIHYVDGKAVSNAADVRGAVRQAKSEGKHAVLLNVKTSKGIRFFALPIG